MHTWVGVAMKTDSTWAHKHLSVKGELTAQKPFANFMMSGAVLGPSNTLPHLILAVAS